MVLRAVRKILLPMLLGLIALLFSSSSYAACAAPAGVEGDLRWDAGNLKYCLGNNTWRIVTGTNKTGACTNGTIQFVSGQLRLCRGSVWKHVSSEIQGEPGSNGSDASNSCVAGNTGEFYYDTGRDFYVYCNGTLWFDFW